MQHHDLDLLRVVARSVRLDPAWQRLSSDISTWYIPKLLWQRHYPDKSIKSYATWYQIEYQDIILTLWALVLIAVNKAYGSDSFPSTLTVVPTDACETIRSAISETFKSSASAENSWTSSFFTAWKSIGSRSKKSKSTSTISYRSPKIRIRPDVMTGLERTWNNTWSSSPESSPSTGIWSLMGSSALRLLMVIC